MYRDSQLKHIYNKQISSILNSFTPEFFANLSLWDQIWGLFSLADLMTVKNYTSLFKLCLHSLTQSLIAYDIRTLTTFLNIFIQYIIKNNIDFPDLNFLYQLNYQETKTHSNFKMEHYFLNYNRLKSIVIEPQHIEKMLTLTDNELRIMIAECMFNIDNTRALEDAKKPHTGYEISDLDIAIDDGKNYICMPFKTAKEITKQKVDLSYMYQIIRPIISLQNKCIVVFVSVRNISASLDTSIKQFMTFSNSRIEILAGDTLTKFLIANKKI